MGWHKPIIDLSATFVGQTLANISIPYPHNEHQWSMTSCCHWIPENAMVKRWYSSIILQQATFWLKNVCDNFVTISEKWASTEHQRLLAYHHGTWYGRPATLSNNWTIALLLSQKCLQQRYYWVRNLFVNGASTEHQPLLTLHFGKSKGSVVTLTHHHTISRHFRQLCLRQHHYHLWKVNVNSASTIVFFASWKMLGLCSDINASSNDRPAFMANTHAAASLLCPETERPQSVNRMSTMDQWSLNNIWSCNLQNPMADNRQILRISELASLLAKIPPTLPLPPYKIMSSERQQVVWGSVTFNVMKYLMSLQNTVLTGQSIKYDPVYNITTMHAVSYRSY